MLTGLLLVVATTVMLKIGLPIWADIKIKILIKFNKHVLSSNSTWFQTSLLRPIQIKVCFEGEGKLLAYFAKQPNLEGNVRSGKSPKSRGRARVKPSSDLLTRTKYTSALSSTSHDPISTFW